MLLLELVRTEPTGASFPGPLRARPSGRASHVRIPFQLQALLVCQCDAQKAARQLEAEERAEIHRMADVVGEIRQPYQRLIEEPARSALQDAFPDVQLGEPDSDRQWPFLCKRFAQDGHHIARQPRMERRTWTER